LDRKQAEKIVRRDLPGVIKKMLKGLPFRPPDGLAQQIYDTTFEAMVADLLDGTIMLGPEGRLTAQSLESTGILTFKLKDSDGNLTNLSNTQH
jgi:hypothetical protein